MTSDEQLLVYIRNQLGSGQSPENIKQALIQKGWRLDVVNQAMNDVGEVDPVKKAVDVKETNEKSQEKKPSRMKFLLILVVAVVIVLKQQNKANSKRSKKTQTKAQILKAQKQATVQLSSKPEGREDQGYRGEYS